MIFIILLMGVFLGDLLLKKYVEARLPEGKEKTILGGRILIRKLHNRGIALGRLAGRPLLIRRGTFGLINGAVRKTGAALLLGGALCNWFDRFHQGFVTDYFSFNVKWKRLKRLVFNLSDLCIMIGTVLLLLGGIRKGRKKRV